MRQLHPSTNLILAVLGGLGLLATLSLPWFAAPAEDPTPTDGPIERGAWQVARTFKTGVAGQVDGGDALGGARMVLLVAVVAIALLGLAISANAGREGAENLLRVVALAVPVIVVGLAIAHPGTEAPIRIHYGLVVSLAVAFLTANAAYHGASWRAKHAAPVRPRYSR